MKALVRLMTVPEVKRDVGWIEEGLRAAIQLELSTIPPYLYAMWSIDPDADPSDCRGVIASIAREEMLHMGIACNLLTAIGGRPDIVAAAPTYPATLPTHVHDGLEVALAPLSKELLLDTFMVIEEPSAHLVDDPDFTPTGATLIGQFYDDLFGTLEACAPTFSTTGQVDLKGLFDGSFVIGSLDDARAAIDLIKRQGEGTAAGPFERKDDPDELAHFYQFGEIFHGRRLTRTAPFAYTGADVVMPQVREVSPAAATLAEAAAFDHDYSDLLRSLQSAWDGGGRTVLDGAIGAMFGLTAAAEAVLAAGFGPAFRVVDQTGQPVPSPEPAGNRFSQVKEILDAGVGGGTFGAHGAFWRGLSRDQFVTHSVFGQALLVVGNGRESNLVKALRGQLPFGSDVGTAGAFFRRMPAGRDPVADPQIDVVSQWIDDGCPDAAPVVSTPQVSDTTGAFRPDPAVHVSYFRDLDDWSMFHATPEVSAAVGLVFGTVAPWLALARDASLEQPWLEAITSEPTRQAIAMLAARQKQTVEGHYGVPVPLLTVLDGYERFGNDGLPPDPLRPADPRHNMNGAVMWFVHSAFADACVRLDISRDFWTFFMRPILCGLLNDGLFRGRFAVGGFTADQQGRQAVFEHVQAVPDADLAAELRQRYVDSGL